MALLVVFAIWQSRAANPLLPPRVVLDRNRGGAYASMHIASAGMFATFLFLTYYLQRPGAGTQSRARGVRRTGAEIRRQFVTYPSFNKAVK